MHRNRHGLSLSKNRRVTFYFFKVLAGIYMIHKIITCILQQLCMKQSEQQPAGTLEASSDLQKIKAWCPLLIPAHKKLITPATDIGN